MIGKPQFERWPVVAVGQAAETQRWVPTGEFKPPLDIRDWIDPWVLATWAEEEVERLYKNEPAMAEFLSPPPEYRPQMLLRLLAFAYASRVFDSEEIVQKCYTDAVFRVLCDGEPPIARDLWRFRRNTRALLERILSRVLFRSVQERFGLDSAVPHPELAEDLLHRATERLNIARHMDQA